MSKEKYRFIIKKTKTIIDHSMSPLKDFPYNINEDEGNLAIIEDDRDLCYNNN